jgi:MFS family permease
MTLDTIQPWLNFVHPVVMWLLLAATLYALYLGIQARRTRLADADTRKELIKGKFALKHHQVGSVLLAAMVLGTVGGMGATYLEAGKLFVGPHLLVGLGMAALIATSAALVPFMQKGNETARLTHITLNMVLVGLFSWQAFTGMKIVQRLLSDLQSGS